MLTIIAQLFIADELVFRVPILNEGLLSVASSFLNAPLQSTFTMLDILHLLRVDTIGSHLGSALLAHRRTHVADVTVLISCAAFLGSRWFQLSGMVVLVLALEGLLDELVLQDAHRLVTCAFLTIHNGSGEILGLERLGRFSILENPLAPLLVVRRSSLLTHQELRIASLVRVLVGLNLIMNPTSVTLVNLVTATRARL